MFCRVTELLSRTAAPAKPLAIKTKKTKNEIFLNCPFLWTNLSKNQNFRAREIIVKNYIKIFKSSSNFVNPNSAFRCPPFFIIVTGRFSFSANLSAAFNGI